MKELLNLISSLSEENFKLLVKEYLKEKYNTPHVRIIDGPYDGGNDLEVFINDKEIRKNIQVTVQKTGFETKLKRDIEKSSKNVKRFHYLNNLDFFINQIITKQKRNELTLFSELNFAINLNIYDAKFFEQESENFPSIRNITYRCHNLKTDTDFKFADKQSKILFDVLTLNHRSIEIKRNFIYSYIFSFLYAKPNSSIEEVLEYLNTHLNNSLYFEYVEKELNYLRSKKCLVSHNDKKRFILSEEKQKEISEIYSNVTLQEKQLREIIEDFIAKKGIDCSSDELANILFFLYQENYTIDIDEVNSTNNSFGASIKKTFNDLVLFFMKKGLDEEKSKMASKDLIIICQSNEFLNKLSSVYLFNNLYSSNKLESYINSKKPKIFLDTQILIRMICVLYNEKIDFVDTAMQSIKILLSTFEKFKDKIDIYSSYDYVDEVAGHLLEALKLQRFLNLPFIVRLGKSKNVFYNTYIELLNNNYFEDDYDFIYFIGELLDEDFVLGNDKDFLRSASKKIAQILELSDIKLIYHDTYSNYLIIKKEYEISLAMQSKVRSAIATDNDLRTIIYLATKDYHQDQLTKEFNEPFLITWDSAFYSFRKKLLTTHKELSYWYIYSPLKVVDRLSVMNFNLNSKSISLNIVALTETNFNYSSKTTSFIDVISSFFHTDDVSKLSIIHKLIDLKEDTKNIQEVPSHEEFKESEEDNITQLLLNLKGHYHSYETKYKFDDLIEIFELPQFEDEIIYIFENALSKYRIGQNLDNMFAKFDELISKNKKQTLY